MKRLLKHSAVAAALAVAATFLIVSPASAARLSTTVDANPVSPVRTCPANDCRSLGGAPFGTAVRSYCAFGTFDLVFSEGVANRIGFIARTALANETQTASCFSVGSGTSVNGDVDLRACANANCNVVGDAAFGDILRQFCGRIDSARNAWIGVFNTNGPQAGFARATELIGAPAPGLPSC